MTTQFDVYHGDGSIRPIDPSVATEVPAIKREHGRYLSDPELVEAVNLAICVGQPLLVTGEPGCGKTRLAWSVASELGLGEPLEFYTRSTSRAGDLLYRFDAVRRFYDIQAGDQRAKDPANYVEYEALGRAIVEGKPRVVMIDEIDKAPRDFPNDLLNEFDRMCFTVWELPKEQREKASEVRPIIIITSNSERQLPLPFLRRCVFHRIDFPDEGGLRRIVEERLGDVDLDGGLVTAAVERFREVREVKGIYKRPATGELLAWTFALHAQGKTGQEVRDAQLSRLPLWQVLLKDWDDYRALVAAT